jgi:arginase
VSAIVVPYHQDERLGDGVMPLPLAVDVRVLAPELPEGDIWHRLAALDDATANQVAASVSDGGPTIVLSGDCLVAIAALAGAQRAGLDPGLVWFDAHGDVHTLDTTTSHYLGGLALRLALGAHPELLAQPLGLQPVTDDRALLVGARDLDPAETEYLQASAVRRREVADLDTASLPDGPLIVHVDLDVTDPGELPGLLFPAPGGPSAAQVVAAVQRILATGRVAVLNIACPWHPTSQDHVQQARADLLNQLTGAVTPR